MAKKEKENLMTKPVAELEKELNEQKEKLVDLKFNLSAGKVKNIKEVKKVKLKIAQLLTALNIRPK